MPLYGQSGWGFGRYGIADGGPVYALPIEYYLRLLTSEYQNSPIFLGWLRAALGPLDDITNLGTQFTGAFDLDTAVGPQLDMLGVIVGQSRTVAFQPTGNVSPTLDDDTYRLLLKARIAQDTWDGTIDSLQTIWSMLFPGGRIVIGDQQNMTATVIVSGAFSSITQDLITQGYIVPRPETVLYDYVVGDLPLFGVDLDNAYIAGVDKGHVAQ